MSAQTKIRKGTFQHIESELFAYHETRQEIVRLKNDLLYGSSDSEATGGGRGNLPGDPTGRTATLMITHRRIEQLERISEAIESVYEALPEDKKKFVYLRYWKKPQLLTWDGIAAELNVSRRQAFRWREEVIWAISSKLGWR